MSELLREVHQENDVPLFDGLYHALIKSVSELHRLRFLLFPVHVHAEGVPFFLEMVLRFLNL